jgi:small subunit ribosomal protein S20
MAQHNSALRQRRRSIRRNIVNRQNKSALRTEIKKLREAIQKSDKETAPKLLSSTVSMIDKSVKKGAIQKKSARPKSRLPGRRRWSALPSNSGPAARRAAAGIRSEPLDERLLGDIAGLVASRSFPTPRWPG